jgi:uncharacterized protein with NRDE domain
VCTLLLGWNTVAPGSVILAANRDEDPARPSRPPEVLIEDPRVVGGRDLTKGGTWLAIRERRAAVAMLNRRSDPGVGGAEAGLRSRGLLALEVAAAGDGTALPALEHAFDAIRGASFAPFSLLFASPEACWLVTHDPAGRTTASRVFPGWHALTHADLDDPHEPRTAWLMRSLARLGPRSIDETERELAVLLRSHGANAAGNDAASSERDAPPVCLHEGPMVTVSASTAFIARDETRYRHAEGRPCEHELRDCSELLAGRLPALEVS